MERKIILELEDQRLSHNIFKIKSVMNSIEWSIGQSLSPNEVELLLALRSNVEIKIVGVN
jgi:hypothetical protein